jgi:pSer/pThr/pTyr-binding forkhead associated (FHA) protein
MAAALLRVIGGATAGRQISLDDDFVVGRGEDGLGNLGGDSEISRRHARFRQLGGGQILVEDLNSTNGTLVNGQRISAPYVLAPGDQITLGKTTLQLEGGAPAAAAPVATPTPAPVAATPAAAAPAPAAMGPLPDLARGAAPAARAGESAGRGRGLQLALAGLVLLAIGVGLGLIINKDSGKSSSSTTASNASTTTPSNAPTGSGPEGSTGAALSPQGLPDPSGFSCVGDKNGTPGPGHFRFITSGCENATSTIAQFPLQKGTSGGKTVWYVVTDSSSKADALARHVNYAPKLANAIGTPGVQTVKMVNGVIDFPATVNFAPQRTLQPGPDGFPPAKASPPSVGNAGYSPLIKLPSGIVINAPHVANDSGHADKALKLDMAKGTVLYQETEGRYEDKHVHYASFESGNPAAATIEDVTYAPAFNTIPKAGDIGLKTSARERLIAFVNGPTGIANPGRQGINSTILDQADPHNILQEVPVLPQHSDVGDPKYTPGWDVHFAAWTPAAINTGARVEIQSGDEVDLRVKDGLVTAPGGKKFGPSNFTVNCPLISIDIP